MDINPFAGVWSLISFTRQTPDGWKFYPFGENAVGQLIYTETWHMSVTYMQAGRQKFASIDAAAGTEEEIREAYFKFDAYTGTYDVDINAGTVTHHVKVSRQPDLEGTNLLRYFSFSDDILELVTPPILVHDQDNIYTLTWRRIG